MTIEDFKMIDDQAGADLNSMPDNIKDAMDYQAFTLPNIQYEWSKRYKRQKFTCEQLKTAMKEMWGKKIEHYKFHDNYHWDTTKEIEARIECDPDWVKLVKEYNTQSYMLEQIEEYYDLIKRLDFKVHDYLEYKKLELAKY